MKNNETKDFIAYEYLSLNVKSEREPLYVDCYETLGWTLVNNTALIDKDDYYINTISYKDSDMINIKLKRDRRIKNKIQLQSLQRKLESALKELERLEKQPWSIATIKSMVVAIIGAVFMAISVIAITAKSPIYALSIITGVIGIVGWVLPYFVYLKEKVKCEKENVSLIEEQYNIIYDTCEQAQKLSN